LIINVVPHPKHSTRPPTHALTVNPSDSFFPHTRHSAIRSPNEVYFLRDFSLGITETGQPPQTIIDDPRYLFAKKDDCARFQSWLRRKQSVETFEIETIKASEEEVAHNVGLKVWQDAFDGPSLSLFANKLTTDKRADMNLEFPIGLFKCDKSLGKTVKSKKTPKTIKLEFEIPKKESIISFKRLSLRRNSQGLAFSHTWLLTLILHRNRHRPR
jgi:hypothetical protein